MFNATRGIALIQILFLLYCFILLTACNQPKGSPENGNRWYLMHNCFGCHGKNGNDGKAPDINNLNMSYRSFKNRLRNAETAIMPAYSEEKITDQDAADILAWLQSLK